MLTVGFKLAKFNSDSGLCYYNVYLSTERFMAFNRG